MTAIPCPRAPDWCGRPGDPYLPCIGDTVRHRNGGAPWLVLEVQYGPNPIEMVIARREVIGVKALHNIQRYARSDGQRTFDDCIRDLERIDDICRGVLK